MPQQIYRVKRFPAYQLCTSALSPSYLSRTNTISSSIHLLSRSLPLSALDNYFSFPFLPLHISYCMHSPPLLKRRSQRSITGPLLLLVKAVPFAQQFIAKTPRSNLPTPHRPHSVGVHRIRVRNPAFHSYMWKVSGSGSWSGVSPAWMEMCRCGEEGGISDAVPGQDGIWGSFRPAHSFHFPFFSRSSGLGLQVNIELTPLTASSQRASSLEGSGLYLFVSQS